MLSAMNHFPQTLAAIGLDVNAAYLDELKGELAGRPGREKASLLHASFFTTDWSGVLGDLPEPMLVIGNPPWVTNAALGALGSANLPKKSNFQKHSGLDAITGKGNFDISEWMLIQCMEWLDGRNGTLAMLCKTAVGRKLLLHAWKNNMRLGAAALYGIDAALHFNATVDACLLVCEFRPRSHQKVARVYASLDSNRAETQLGWRAGHVVANVTAFDRWAHLVVSGNNGQYTWRSGVKHDCSKVMELSEKDGHWFNKLGECVEIEPTFVFPMLKSSGVAKGHVANPTSRMIVTQSAVNEDTAAIRDRAPKTWAYLISHADLLDGRRSSIYRNRPRFSVFGVGDYAFSSHKVAISGFYKRLHFEVVPAHRGKPVVLDDTVYFLACESKDEAEFLAEMLNSDVAREFYSAFVFWDAKRPITVEVLRRLDLRKLARHLGRIRDFEKFAIPERSAARQKYLF
ncbi:MAG: hypothetical protein ACC628_17260 [Pirellulaceae bacterium]